MVEIGPGSGHLLAEAKQADRPVEAAESSAAWSLLPNASGCGFLNTRLTRWANQATNRRRHTGPTALSPPRWALFQQFIEHRSGSITIPGDDIPNHHLCTVRRAFTVLPEVVAVT